MLSQIDLIIITGFIEKNVDQFNQFCIDECIGTKGTGPATLRHLKNIASQQPDSAENETCMFCGSRDCKYAERENDY